MIRTRSSCSFLTLVVFLAAACASQEYQPEVGQAGKDVEWVPTSQVLVEKMLDLGKLTSNDYVMDLGSGDGRIVITAAKRGVRGAVGIEYDPDMVALSRRNAAREGVADKTKFVKADVFETDLSPATLITMFLRSDLNLRLRPKILDLKPGTRIVSNYFDMGKWPPDHIVLATEQEGCGERYCTAYLWIVPAKVEGTWKLPDGQLTLKQTFQMLTGTLRKGGRETAIKGRMNGDEISFRAGASQYSGRVDGDAIKGVVRSGGAATEWSATRRAS